MVDFLDSVHRIGADHVAVQSLPRFWDYLDKITPKILRNIQGISDNYLGFPIREDLRCPPDQVWFFAEDGQFLGGIDLHPEPPELCS